MTHVLNTPLYTCFARYDPGYSQCGIMLIFAADRERGIEVHVGLIFFVWWFGWDLEHQHDSDDHSPPSNDLRPQE
jgi:hypothetical protein